MHKSGKLALTLAIYCVIIISSVSVIASTTAQPGSFISRGIGQEDGLSIRSYNTEDFIVFDLTFPEPSIDTERGYSTVEIPDLPRHGDPGKPVLPFRVVRALIPQGKSVVNVQATHVDWRTLKGSYQVEYGRTPVPVGSKPTTIDRPDQKIYASLNPFPSEPISQAMEQYMCGFKILLVTVYPIRYTPKHGELVYARKLTITINLEHTEETSLLLRNLPQDRNAVRGAVDNPAVVETYTSSLTTRTPVRPTSIVNPADSYQYVIITNSSLNASFTPLKDSKIGKGLTATIVFVQDILNDSDYFCDGLYGDGNCVNTAYNGSAARIRNFIRDAYQNWETEYVLLGGDVQILPHRGMYGYVPTNPSTQDYNMPSDIYFGALDGNWDNDNDTIFGERMHHNEGSNEENGTAGDEADYYAEVFIGRAPVITEEQAQNFVNKTLWYEQTTDEEYLKKAVMIGEELDEETVGATNKDNCADSIPQFTMTRLYQRDNTYSTSAVKTAINNGVHILNHDGHCNTDSMMGMSKSDIDEDIVNTKDFFFGYSVGCYAAAYDMDSVVEHFVFSANGSFAFISNSRYGWYSPGTMFGAGDQYDKSFFDVLNTTVQNLGKTLQASKEPFASSTLSYALRWTYFELNLLGDPEIEIETDLKSPTAHFWTNPTADRLGRAVIKGLVNLTGIAKKGTAVGATFNNYTIQYYNSTIGWTSNHITHENNGNLEVNDGLLGTWDTNNMKIGPYALRIVVNGTDGTISEDRWLVIVEELPAIRVLPQLGETQAGRDFTISVRITDPEALTGVDFKMTWNTTFLQYQNHSVYIPWDDYRWGVLYDPATIHNDDVNPITGTYWINATSTAIAEFEDDGTVFNMTFKVLTNGTSHIGVYDSDLTGKFGVRMTHKVLNGTVDISPGVHDAAVTNCVPSKSYVGQGFSALINVTITNEGTFTEDIQFTVYANGTEMNTTMITLVGLQSETVGIYWNTTGWAKGNYTISVNVTQVLGEDDMTDNLMTGGWMWVTTPGDVEGYDGDVDIYDIVTLVASYGKSEGDPGYNPDCDIDGNGICNIFDVVIAANNYGA